MSEPATPQNGPLTITESQASPSTDKEIVFRCIRHTLHDSEAFPLIQPSTVSQLRAVYDHLTKPHGDYHHVGYPAIYYNASSDGSMSMACLKLSFLFLEEELGLSMELRTKIVAILLRLSLWHSESPCQELSLTWYFLHIFGGPPGSFYWIGPPGWHTQKQFDSLVEYHLRICQNQDYHGIYDTYVVLAALGRSPSNLTSKRNYIDTIIRFMGPETPLFARYAALNAARAISNDISSIGQDDKPFQIRFSEALAQTIISWNPSLQFDTSPTQHPIIGRDPGTQLDNNSSDAPVFLDWQPDVCYLRLLCVLAEKPTWHDQLEQSGHFDRCLALADALLSLDFDEYLAFIYAAYVAHIFALIIQMGPDYPFFRKVQVYPGWQLILQAWCHIFQCDFFEAPTERNWQIIRNLGFRDALPRLLAYAQTCRHRDNTEEAQRLIHLVSKVCDKLKEEERRDNDNFTLEQDPEEYRPFGHVGIPVLIEEIFPLLHLEDKDVYQPIMRAA